MKSGSLVTIHMAASLDGFIARKDGRVDWMETADEFAEGQTMDPEFAKEFLAGIGCYVMGSRTYETALDFEDQGFGWAYGDKPVYVLTTRKLPRTRDTVAFHAGDLTAFVQEVLRPQYRKIWIAGGASLCTECLRLGLADEIVYTVLPVLIGEGMPFFTGFQRDLPLHLADVKAYKNGIVETRYEILAAS